MKKRLLFTIVFLFLIGCTPKITEDTPSENQFNSLESTLDELINKKSDIGKDHYNKLNEQIKALESSETERLLEKLESIPVSGRSETKTIRDSDLPSCGDKKELFTVLPIKLDDFKGIFPLGLVDPTIHVFPTPHIYFHIKPEDPSNFGESISAQVPVVAPADIVMTNVKSTSSDKQEFDDNDIYFSVCKEFTAYFAHVKNLSPKIQKAIDNAKTSNCNEYTSKYSSGLTRTSKVCDIYINVPLKAGEFVGMAGGGRGQNNLDLGARDFRIQPAPFINPNFWSKRETELYTVCPLDYFSSELSNILKSRLGSMDGQVKRTKEPICGEVYQDIIDTAQGLWYAKNVEVTSNHRESFHIALVPDVINNNKDVFSVGESVKESGLSFGFYSFTIKSSGNVNRAFKDIKFDGNVYCYETEDKFNKKIPFVILLELTSKTNLRIEKVDSDNCAEPPWSFDKYSEFIR